MFGLELLDLALVLDDDDWLVLWASLDLERPELAVFLDDGVGELASDESLRIENGIGRVSGGLILGSVANKSLLLGEGHVGRSRVQALIVRDDLDLVVLEDTDARVRRAQIDSNSCIGHASCGRVRF